MYKYLAPSSPNPFSPGRRGIEFLAPFSLRELRCTHKYYLQRFQAL
ncbi:hypothetical protein FDUTEX481_05758 [Tolypothrix sp. PCC 7601]|nr:hypothetical protein FDUTEX481_05758 [Tolypothrix sp. PCC 7601]